MLTDYDWKQDFEKNCMLEREMKKHEKSALSLRLLATLFIQVCIFSFARYSFYLQTDHNYIRVTPWHWSRQGDKYVIS